MGRNGQLLRRVNKQIWGGLAALYLARAAENVKAVE